MTSTALPFHMRQHEIDELEWEPVDSSNIEALAFAQRQTIDEIFVKYKTGQIYLYTPDSEHTGAVKGDFEKLVLAESVGRAVNLSIKPNYGALKVVIEPEEASA